MVKQNIANDFSQITLCKGILIQKGIRIKALNCKGNVGLVNKVKVKEM